MLLTWVYIGIYTNLQHSDFEITKPSKDPLYINQSNSIMHFIFFVYVFQNISRTDLWHLQVNGVYGGDDIWCSTDCPTFYWRNFRPFAPLDGWGQMEGEVILDLEKVTLTPPIKVIWGHKDRKMPHMHKPFQFNASPDTS